MITIKDWWTFIVICFCANLLTLHFGKVSRMYWHPGGWCSMKMPSYQYRNSHYGDKTILRLSYLHNGISYSRKTAFYIESEPIVHLLNTVAFDLKDLAARWTHHKTTCVTKAFLCCTEWCGLKTFVGSKWYRATGNQDTAQMVWPLTKLNEPF